MHPTPDTKPLITVYDYLKIAALLLMVIDHLGAFFFVYDPAWRAIGRLSAPVWLFLIGYARSRNVTKQLVGGAVILTAVSLYVQQEYITQNILWSFILIRLTLNPVMRWIGQNETRLLGVTAALFVASPVTGPFVDYGSIGYILAMWGYIVRNGFAGRASYPQIFGVISLCLYGFVEIESFAFGPALAALVVFGLAGVYYALMRYLPGGAPGLVPRNKMARTAIAFMGRRTLEFYVLHLVIIYAITAWLCQCHGACFCIPLGIEPLRHLY